MNDLYDEIGYAVKMVLSKTFNPRSLGENDDDRNLGVFVTYIGAVKPEHERANYIYENDMFVVSRMDPENGSIWNANAIKGFWGYEGKGTWSSKESIVNIKDAGIRSSGLKITYNVPRQLVLHDVEMKIFVNDYLVTQQPIGKEGVNTIVLDVESVGKEDKEYIIDAHRILKILLKDFDRVCNKYNLKYYLICGSLLGAVRNQNLIPWDDDVDVAMTRKDFDILLKHAGEEWNSGKEIEFVNYNQMHNHTFLDYMTRIIYMKEEIPLSVFKKIRGKGRSDIDNHMPLDIYVLDNASDNMFLHNLQTNIITGLYGLAMGHRAYFDISEYMNRDIKTQNTVKALATIGKFVPLKFIFALYEWVRKWFKNKKSNCYFESNGFVYCIPWKFEKKWFNNGKRMLIDNIEICVPEIYEEFLKKHYGDYMQLPPMEARKPTHSIKASGIH